MIINYKRKTNAIYFGHIISNNPSFIAILMCKTRTLLALNLSDLNCYNPNKLLGCNISFYATPEPTPSPIPPLP